MHKIAIAESILTRMVGANRIAAILGDLLEGSETRGAHWFWIAYIRTVISLGWRGPVAFLGGFAGFNLMMFALLASFRGTRAAWQVGYGGSLLSSLGPLLAGMATPLWFALPYARSSDMVSAIDSSSSHLRSLWGPR